MLTKLIYIYSGNEFSDPEEDSYADSDNSDDNDDELTINSSIGNNVET